MGIDPCRREGSYPILGVFRSIGVCVLLGKAGRRLIADGIKSSCIDLIFGSVSNVVEGHVEMCLRKILYDSVDVPHR